MYIQKTATQGFQYVFTLIVLCGKFCKSDKLPSCRETENKPNFERNYIFPIDLKPNGIPFSFKSIGEMINTI